MCSEFARLQLPFRSDTVEKLSKFNLCHFLFVHGYSCGEGTESRFLCYVILQQQTSIINCHNLKEGDSKDERASNFIESSTMILQSQSFPTSGI